MAIKDSFNLSQATTSQSYAYKCWYNYNYGNNTMKISAKDMGEITQTWNSELKNWRANAENDDNKYEIEDDDYSTAKLNGKESAKDKTGYDGGTGGTKARGIGDAVSSIGNVVSTYIGKKVATKIATKVATQQASKIISNVGANVVASGTAKTLMGKAISKTATKVAEKATTEAAEKATKAVATATAGKTGMQALQAKAAAEMTVGKEAADKAAKETGAQVGKDAGKSVGCIVGCTLGLASGVAYMAKKPNKDEKEACKELQNTMRDSQASLQMAQEDMTSAGDEIVDLSDQAIAYNEDANSNIEDKKTEYDMYKTSYDALMNKAKANETLSEDEKLLLKELVPVMQQLGLDIEDISNDTTDSVGEIYDEMGTYQDTYDNAAETMGEVQGVTDYAESFDEATRTMCYVEGAAQTLNAASSAKSSYEAFALASSGSWAFGATAWAYAFGVMGVSGAAMSGVGVKEQFDWANKVSDEIDLRKETQDFNATSLEMYDENIDVYQGQLEGVEDLEMEIPEDMEDPEGLAEQLGEESGAILSSGVENTSLTKEFGSITNSNKGNNLYSDNDDYKKKTD